MNQRKKIIITVLLVASVIAAIIYMMSQSNSVNEISKEMVSQINQLPKSSSDHPDMRLADGVIPPTNTWFSSVVFSDDPQPIFAYPLTYKPGANQQEIGLPTFTSTDKTMIGTHDPTIKMSIPSKSYQLKSYDDLSAEIAYLDESNNEVATVRVTQGSPYIFVTSQKSQVITLTVPASLLKEKGKGEYQVSAGKKTFGVYTSEHDTRDDGTTLTINAKPNMPAIAIFALPQNGDNESYYRLAANEITGGAVEYEVQNNIVRARYRLSTQNNQPTYFATLPHHNISLERAKQNGYFDNLYGTQHIIEGNSFLGETPLLTPQSYLQIERLSAEEQDVIRATLRDESRSLTLEKTDTYFGGKELYRAANLLMLANELSMDEEKQIIQQKLSTALEIWLKPKGADGASNLPRSFYYDTTIKGVVGNEPAFGSEAFNDHHFHYAYFIYAAAMLARYDSNFIGQHGKMIDVIVSDIASEKTSEYFPKTRVFDRYMGHSWASGYSNFADGNNQESSSEAINAWSAVYQWADITGNEGMKRRGLWLYNQEVASTKQYWLNTSSDNPAFDSYKHTIVAMNWGGKRDYATFFSPRPQAMLGIQLIPMSPAHRTYLDTVDKDLRGRHLAEAAPQKEDYSGQFSDYLWMYRSLDNRQQAIEEMKKLSDTEIDDANSRAYLYAWIYTAGR